MARNNGAHEEKEDDFFDRVTEMAESIGLKGGARQKYVHEHMTRSGYKMVPSYIRDGEQGEDDDDFFGGRSTQRRRRGNDDDDSGSGSGWF